MVCDFCVYRCSTSSEPSVKSAGRVWNSVMIFVCLAGTTFLSIYLVFVDGPVVLQYADIPSVFLDASDANGVGDQLVAPLNPPRAWWRMNDDRTKAVGLERSLEVLRDVLLEGDFVVGIFYFQWQLSI
jgi:hypothetical protein